MLLTALAALALVAGPAVAQVGVFGTWVRYGDADYYLPVTKRDSLAIRVNMANLGDETSVRDNCVILDVAGLLGSPSVHGPGAQVNDLRLTACLGKAPGTKIADADSAEKGATFTPVTTVNRVGDLNSNGKYDKGEPVYLIGNSTGIPATGLVATTSATAWTLRLTSYTTYAAGTFVFSGDADFSAYGTSALGGSAGSFAVVEREDKAIYLVPGSVGALKAMSLVPEKSIRLLAGVLDQADVKPISLEVLSPELKVGEPIKVKVTLENLGKLAGWGLAVIKLDGIVLDVKPTIVLSPGERTSVILSSFVPPVGASSKLESGDVLEFVDVINDQPAGPTNEQLNDLLAKITALEAKVAALEAEEEVRALAVNEEAGGKSPGLDFALIVVVAGLVLFAFRRRRGQ